MNHFDEQDWDDADEKWVHDMYAMLMTGFVIGVVVTIIMLLIGVFLNA